MAIVMIMTAMSRAAFLWRVSSSHLIFFHILTLIFKLSALFPMGNVFSDFSIASY
jgi:hypothetical protein